MTRLSVPRNTAPIRVRSAGLSDAKHLPRSGNLLVTTTTSRLKLSPHLQLLNPTHYPPEFLDFALQPPFDGLEIAWSR